MEHHEKSTEYVFEDVDSGPFGTSHSSISLGQSLDLDFFCKTKGSDKVIAKAFCSFVGLNISHIKDKDQIMYSFFFFF